jgi:hypothetical protein
MEIGCLQEVPPDKGRLVLKILHGYKHSTSIFDDFIHYEKRQEEDEGRRGPPPSQVRPCCSAGSESLDRMQILTKRNVFRKKKTFFQYRVPYRYVFNTGIGTIAFGFEDFGRYRYRYSFY